MPTPSTSIVSPLMTLVTSCAPAATDRASHTTIGNTTARTMTVPTSAERECNPHDGVRRASVLSPNRQRQPHASASAVRATCCLCLSRVSEGPPRSGTRATRRPAAVAAAPPPTRHAASDCLSAYRLPPTAHLLPPGRPRPSLNDTPLLRSHRARRVRHPHRPPRRRQDDVLPRTPQRHALARQQGSVPARGEPPGADAPRDRGRARNGPLRCRGQHEPLTRRSGAASSSSPARAAHASSPTTCARRRARRSRATRGGPAARACRRWPSSPSRSVSSRRPCDEGFDAVCDVLPKAGRDVRCDRDAAGAGRRGLRRAEPRSRVRRRASCRSPGIGSRVPFGRARHACARASPPRLAADVRSRRDVRAQRASPSSRRIRPMLRFRLGAGLIALSLMTAACGGGSTNPVPRARTRSRSGCCSTRSSRSGGSATATCSWSASRSSAARPSSRPPTATPRCRNSRPASCWTRASRRSSSSPRTPRRPRRSSRPRPRRRCRSSATTGSFAMPTSTSTCRSTT